MTVADTIRQQLGGQRFVAMTGARNFVSAGNALQFRLPRMTGVRVRYVRVELTSDDLYNVSFYDTSLRVVSKATGVYADRLQAVFAEATGLDTHL